MKRPFEERAPSRIVWVDACSRATGGDGTPFAEPAENAAAQTVKERQALSPRWRTGPG